MAAAEALCTTDAGDHRYAYLCETLSSTVLGDKRVEGDRKDKAIQLALRPAPRRSVSWAVPGALVCALAIACGSDGLDRSKKLADLTRDEWNQLCEAAPRAMNTPSCPNGALININDPSLCKRLYGTLVADCTATVATSEDCTSTLAKDPCNAAEQGLSTPACLVTQACFGTLCQLKCQPCNGGTDCLSSCAQYAAGLTEPCASCIMTVFTSPSTCPDFSALPPDECRSACP